MGCLTAHAEPTMTTSGRASSRDAVLGVFRDQCRWMVEGRADLLDSIRDEGTTVDVEDGAATVVSRALHDVTLYGHRGRYRLKSTLHYNLTPAGWRAVLPGLLDHHRRLHRGGVEPGRRRLGALARRGHDVAELVPCPLPPVADPFVDRRTGRGDATRGVVADVVHRAQAAWESDSSALPAGC